MLFTKCRVLIEYEDDKIVRVESIVDIENGPIHQMSLNDSGIVPFVILNSPKRRKYGIPYGLDIKQMGKYIKLFAMELEFKFENE